ncbi:hypothetical protein, partial [Kitasatospora sp. SC0581]|uniref:hypothetical protein n=1 Tax=Kitasatospora sp. SC0581 TaxID=3394360 RepID=UPI003A88DCEF
KTIGTFNLLGLGKYVLDTENFKEEELKDLSISSIKSKDYPLKIVNEKIKEIYSEITNSLDKIMSKASNQ